MPRVVEDAEAFAIGRQAMERVRHPLYGRLQADRQMPIECLLVSQNSPNFALLQNTLARVVLVRVRTLDLWIGAVMNNLRQTFSANLVQAITQTDSFPDPNAIHANGTFEWTSVRNGIQALQIVLLFLSILIERHGGHHLPEHSHRDGPIALLVSLQIYNCRTQWLLAIHGLLQAA